MLILLNSWIFFLGVFYLIDSGLGKLIFIKMGSKASACNAGDPGSIPGSGRSPGEGNGNPLQHSCLEKSHGGRSLIGHSPWGRKESDTTEQLHFHLGFPCGSVLKNLPAI